MVHPVYNLPNILTLFRIILIPVFIIVAYWPPALGINTPMIDNTTILNALNYEFDTNFVRHVILTAIFMVACATDWLDGFLARQLNQSSALGRFLDPVADKLMVAATFILLVQWHPNPYMGIAAIVIICREIAVSALREWMAELGKSTSVAVSYIGKLKTTLQMGAITVFLLNWSVFEPIAYLLLYGAVALTLWSMLIYLKAAWPHLKS